MNRVPVSRIKLRDKRVLRASAADSDVRPATNPPSYQSLPSSLRLWFIPSPTDYLVSSIVYRIPGTGYCRTAW